MEPGQGAAVWLRQGEPAVVQGHHKASVDVDVVGDLLGDVRQYVRALGAEPVPTPESASKVMKALRWPYSRWASVALWVTTTVAGAPKSCSFGLAPPFDGHLTTTS